MVMDGSAIHRGLYRIVAPAWRLRNGRHRKSERGGAMPPTRGGGIDQGRDGHADGSTTVLPVTFCEPRGSNAPAIASSHGRIRQAAYRLVVRDKLLLPRVRGAIADHRRRPCVPVGRRAERVSGECRAQETANNKQRRRIRPPAQGRATRHRAPSCIFALQPPKGHPEGAATSIAPDRTPPEDI